MQCLKITEKVSFNIASVASYVYILSGLKLIEKAKNGPFWRVFENLKLAVKQCYQTGQKLVENAKTKKFQNATFWLIFKHCGLSAKGFFLKVQWWITFHRMSRGLELKNQRHHHDLDVTIIFRCNYEWLLHINDC